MDELFCRDSPQSTACIGFVPLSFFNSQKLFIVSTLIVLVTLLTYFAVLLGISHYSYRRGGKGNDAFFRAGRQSSWPMVAFGMIGASISGVTFVSVPGWARSTGMTYLQMCMGFIFGYAIVAAVLLPLYYRLRLTSIYAYLGPRFGSRTHRTGALFFVLSKLTGASARLYLVCLVLNQFILKPWMGNGLFPFLLTTLCALGLIWIYTRRSGIQTIVRTDALQTAGLLIAGVGLFIAAAQRMGLDFSGVVRTVTDSPMCRIWEWDASSPQAFWRQFLSGIFIVIVMTGLDQDMMQKNLTCRNLREAQKDMFTYGLAFLPVNAFFLALGILLYSLCAQQGLTAPASGDDLLPWLVSSGTLAPWVIIPFTVGIVAAAFSSADSALTALTTTVCIDLLRLEEKGFETGQARRIRRRVHILVTLAFVLCILFFKVADNDNILNAIYVMASYTYGPLLGLYAFGLFTHRRVNDRMVPYLCIASPLICGLLDHYAPLLWNYTFGYELLLLNGALTFAGLWMANDKKDLLAEKRKEGFAAYTVRTQRFESENPSERFYR